MENREFNLIQSLITRLSVDAAIGVADQRAFLEALEKIADQAGVTSIEGKSVRDYVSARQAYHLEEAILRIGDRDPPQAEALQKYLDGLKGG